MTGLNPVWVQENWPPHLQLAVNIILLLPSAAMLLWGPEFIQIYNDRFRDTMGGKHPTPLVSRYACPGRRPGILPLPSSKAS